MKTLLQGKAATAVGVIIRKNLIKFNLPDGHSADFSAAVMEIIFGQVQLEYNHVESGGYLTGYVSKETGNVTIDSISTPYNLDSYILEGSWTQEFFKNSAYSRKLLSWIMAYTS